MQFPNLYNTLLLLYVLNYSHYYYHFSDILLLDLKNFIQQISNISHESIQYYLNIDISFLLNLICQQNLDIFMKFKIKLLFIIL